MDSLGTRIYQLFITSDMGKVIMYFTTSIQHQYVKSKMKQKKIHEHQAHAWTGLLTTFLYRFDKLVTNYNDVADTTKVINKDKKKELLRKSILGFPVLAVEISDKSHARVYGNKMSYATYREHVMDICQLVDISWQESKPNKKPLPKFINDKTNMMIPQGLKLTPSHEANQDTANDDDDLKHEEAVDQDDDDLEVNKLQRKSSVMKPKLKAAFSTFLPSSIYSKFSTDDIVLWPISSAISTFLDTPANHGFTAAERK